VPRGRPPKNTALVADNKMQELLELWNRATVAPRGIRIRSFKPNRLFQLLHWARRECGHANYHHLKVIETESEVWIVPR